jgi:hypothetical protein
MLNTSSMGIKKGLSMSRLGSGMNESIASIKSKMHLASALSGIVALQGLERAAANDRRVIARKLVLAQQLAQLQLHQLDQLFVIDHVALVQKTTMRGTPT